MAPFGDTVGLVARSELRRRWLALAGLALLVGVVGAVALSGFAGARRTASALDRFEDATLARDARVVGNDDETTHALAEALRDEPWVSAVGEFVDFTTNTGVVVLSVYAGTDDVFSNEVDSPLVLDGRMPAEGSTDEVAIDQVAQETFDIGVGDELEVNTFDPDDLQCLITSDCPFQGIPGPPLTLEVVGIMRDVDAFSATEDPTPSATASSAFTDAYRDTVGAVRSEVAVRLADDGDLDRLQAFVDDQPGSATVITPQDDFASGAGDAVDVLGTALLVFAIVSGLAGAFAIFQAVTRQVDAAASGTTVLPALGVTRWGWAQTVALPTVYAVLVGAVLAPIGAAVTSGLYPIGFADEIEPDQGLRFDWPVLLGGALAIVLLFGGWAIVSGRRRCGLTRLGKGWTPTMRWAGLTLAAGARLAFGRWRNRASGPMRSAMVGIAVGTVGAIGATFVLVSLHDLIDEPDRWGVSWDGVGTVADPTQLDATADAIAGEDGVDQVATLNEGLLQVDDREVSAYAFTSVRGDIQPTIRRGRLPDAPNEIALGEVSLDELGVDVGDTLSITSNDDETELEYDVVGAAVLPTYNDLQPAQGALLTPEGLAPVNQAEATLVILVAYDDDADAGAVSDRLAADHAVGFLDPITPSQLSNLDEASLVIKALIVFFVALALVGLIQALTLSGRRQRPNIAIWRSLGFVPREVRWSVLWQSALVTGVAVVVGVPLGLYVGQVAWRLTIENVGVVDDPTLPIVPALAALPVAVLTAVLVALIPAWLAARGEPAEALHAE